ncbi:hypothetical protein [Rhodothermus marinus]|uniref:hypothetical protein n=1 Tax=Rhodothermus marinus TaxID=29549 RepID=UPI001FB2AD1E|nr:hypothetical protein [Rhodothermus marinus]
MTARVKNEWRVPRADSAETPVAVEAPERPRRRARTNCPEPTCGSTIGCSSCWGWR